MERVERERFVPSLNFKTGFEVETRSITWTIKRFPLIRKYGSMIDSQAIDFTGGETTGHTSRWSVYLKESKSDDKRWIGLYLKLVSPRPNAASLKTTHSKVRFTIKNKEGGIIRNLETGLHHVATRFLESGGSCTGFSKVIDADDEKFCPDESLVVQVTFQLYNPPQPPPKSPNSLEAIMEGLLKKPVLRTEIKIISEDKQEFSMPRGALVARSDVFAAMLRSDMLEANSGVIQLPDISSKALKVLLNFLKTGDLLPEWSETGVIVELVNAAGKYQLQDLLQFLDATMGKVCQLENVGELTTLARQLSLKMAEEELMTFVRMEGFGSLDNAIQMSQMSSTQAPVIDSVPTPDPKGGKGKKRKKNED